MEKTIIYTSNPNFVPNNLVEVHDFAVENNKFYSCVAKEGTEIYDLQPGAHILTTKGNHVYVLETHRGVYLNNAKKSNITGIVSVEYPFVDNKPKENKSKMKFTNKNISNKIKEMFIPTEVNDVKITMDGNICVLTDDGYVAIDNQNNLTAYPEEFVIDLPVFVISKPKNQVVVGDIILINNKYAKVTSVKDGKISAIGYNGCNKRVNIIKDFLLNTQNVRVVVSLAGNINGQINPMMLMAMLSKNSKKSLLPLLMMNQNNANLDINPMMLMLMNDNEDSSIQDFLMFSMINGKSINNLFQNK